MMFRRLCKLAVVALLAGISLGPLSATAAGAAPYATVWRLRGDVAAEASGSGNSRKLKDGDQVYVGEHIKAGAAGEAVLRTNDDGMVAVRPGSEFAAVSYVANGDSADNFTIRLISGSLRLISGWIGHSNRLGSRVQTSTATIGIRGTDHEPYVLQDDIVGESTYRAGTYDKVNRGGTTLETAPGQSVDVDPGRVGFARRKDRALLAVLLPVLLEKVPSFYVPGAFDAELDKFSETADTNAVRKLEQVRKGGAAAGACPSGRIAESWLEQLDGAIARRDAMIILSMFSADVKIKATVLTNAKEASTVDITRSEFVQSTLTALKQLEGYKHRRTSIAAKTSEVGGKGECQRILVNSRVVEQGRQAGKPFRFESDEQYLLEQRDGRWIAVEAETIQR